MITASAVVVGAYRYRLIRGVSVAGLRIDPDRRLVVVMCNPSTADEHHDDPTIRRVVRFAARHGFGVVDVVNLFAFRATDPAEVWSRLADGGEDVVGGAMADVEIRHAVARASKVLVAWGALPKKARPRIAAVVPMLGPDLVCLGVTRDGSPRHPLFVPASTPLQPWRPR